ncbi:uncharacterized protein LOC115624715 [Scaptodrosophila lebanonensis]|uniref:Uncharacterized protein LOC115624715 n=1 Tax=Drosophila lebanonensis TaxID=7225 RepID=A0A6J2TJT6_DROLE|nr:uncharacterized protein LOC115624715 [Scaptodrosophila lebanonensis]
MFYLIKCGKLYVFEKKKCKIISKNICLTKINGATFEAEIINSSESKELLEGLCKKMNEALYKAKSKTSDGGVNKENIQKDSVKQKLSYSSEVNNNEVELYKELEGLTSDGGVNKENIQKDSVKQKLSYSSEVNNNEVELYKELVGQTSDGGVNKENIQKDSVKQKLSYSSEVNNNEVELYKELVGQTSDGGVNKENIQKDFEAIGADGFDPILTGELYEKDNCAQDIENEAEPFEDSGSEYIDENESEKSKEEIVESQPNRKRRSTSPFGKTQRIRWSPPERKEMEEAFGNFKSLKRLPSLAECNRVIAASQYLKRRTPAQLKSWIDNQRKAESRKKSK